MNRKRMQQIAVMIGTLLGPGFICVKDLPAQSVEELTEQVETLNRQISNMRHTFDVLEKKIVITGRKRGVDMIFELFKGLTVVENIPSDGHIWQAKHPPGEILDRIGHILEAGEHEKSVGEPVQVLQGKRPNRLFRRQLRRMALCPAAYRTRHLQSCRRRRAPRRRWTCARS